MRSEQSLGLQNNNKGVSPRFSALFFYAVSLFHVFLPILGSRQAAVWKELTPHSTVCRAWCFSEHLVFHILKLHPHYIRGLITPPTPHQAVSEPQLAAQATLIGQASKVGV